MTGGWPGNSTESERSDLPRIIFSNINGSGMGHLSRCLAYMRRLQGNGIRFRSGER